MRVGLHKAAASQHQPPPGLPCKCRTGLLQSASATRFCPRLHSGVLACRALALGMRGRDWTERPKGRGGASASHLTRCKGCDWVGNARRSSGPSLSQHGGEHLGGKVRLGSGSGEVKTGCWESARREWWGGGEMVGGGKKVGKATFSSFQLSCFLKRIEFY